MVVAVLVAAVGAAAEVPWWITVPVTVAAARAVTQWLARGMTSPLREMTGAARAMAVGDYSQRVTASSSDEVGQLAVAFNAMAADLAASDEERRRLVATVSHGLRTPRPRSGRCWRTSSTGWSAPTTRRCVGRFGSPSGSVRSSPTCWTWRVSMPGGPPVRHRGAGR